jgi:hypothetical protein
MPVTESPCPGSASTVAPMLVSTLVSPPRRGERTNTLRRGCLVSSRTSVMPAMLPRAGRAHIGAESGPGDRTLVRWTRSPFSNQAFPRWTTLPRSRLFAMIGKLLVNIAVNRHLVPPSHTTGIRR